METQLAINANDSAVPRLQAHLLLRWNTLTIAGSLSLATPLRRMFLQCMGWINLTISDQEHQQFLYQRYSRAPLFTVAFTNLTVLWTRILSSLGKSWNWWVYPCLALKTGHIRPSCSSTFFVCLLEGNLIWLYSLIASFIRRNFASKQPFHIS